MYGSISSQVSSLISSLSSVYFRMAAINLAESFKSKAPPIGLFYLSFNRKEVSINWVTSSGRFFLSNAYLTNFLLGLNFLMNRIKHKSTVYATIKGAASPIPFKKSNAFLEIFLAAVSAAAKAGKAASSS